MVREIVGWGVAGKVSCAAEGRAGGESAGKEKKEASGGEGGYGGGRDL